MKEELKSQIFIFEGNKMDGIFSRNKKFYPDNYTEEDIEQEIKKSRIKLGEKYNFSGLKMFQVEQKMEDNDVYEDDKTVIIDKKYLSGEDYFQEKIQADILIITNKYPEIVLCHRMADCPVLIAEDRKLGVSAIAHCGIYHINRGLPKALINSLIKLFHSKPQDIYLYIGSHIKKDSYIYDTYPHKASNKEIWENAIEEDQGKYKIDLEKAITNQLREFPLAKIMISPIDTAKDDRYASHYEAVKGNNEKKGQNIVGFYYKRKGNENE